MDKQIENHKNTIAKIGKLGQVSANHSLEKCLYSINIGSNDFINYFKPDDYNWSSIYNPDQFADALILQYTQQIKVITQLSFLGPCPSLSGIIRVHAFFFVFSLKGKKSGTYIRYLSPTYSDLCEILD